MPAIEHAVIAAAGLGSRLGYGLPKCLVEIDGRTLIERQLELLRGIPDVRVVVGYMEQAVIEAVSRFDRNVIFVRNPDFRTTTTQDSYALGADGLDGQCLFLDADIVFDPKSLHDFLLFSARRLMTVGVTQSKTDDAVYAVTRDAPDGGLEIVAFSRQQASHEWANIVCLPANSFTLGKGPVFEALQPMLPSAAKVVVSYEIDTERDLRRAEDFVNGRRQCG